MAALLDVLASNKSPSKAAQLRAALPEIDEAIAAGYTHAEILNVLNQRGLNMTFTVYQTTLFRVRKLPKKEKPRAAATPTSTKEAPATAPKTSSGKQPFVFNKTPEKDIWN